MSEATTAVEPAAEEHSLGKVPLTEMADWVRSEADRLSIWASVTQNPDHKRWMRQRAHVADMTAKTIELLQANEKRFVQMVRAEREAENRKSQRRGD
jgi:hypothetical protein